MNNLKKFVISFITIITILSVSTDMGDIGGGACKVYADTTVYVTRTGSKYHSHKCGNGTYYKSTLSAAEARGLGPCKKCYGSNPPSSSSSSGKKSSIKLSHSSKVLVVGKSFKLKLKGAKSKVTWKNSNKKVIKVSKSGKVTAKKKGKATVTAISGDTKKKCKVTVEEPYLSQTSIVMYVDEEIDLQLLGCAHYPEWESEDDYIAEVYDGTVYAWSSGETVIKARIHGKTYKCVVTVLDSVEEVNSMDTVVE